MPSFKFVHEDSQMYYKDLDNLFNHGKKGGKKGLTDKHKKCIKEFVAKDASVYVKDVMDYLISVFGEIDVLKETIRRFIATTGKKEGLPGVHWGATQKVTQMGVFHLPTFLPPACYGLLYNLTH
ncbi:hypothetical protein PHYBLDRAFT_173465 [Phycomyces blakesleeanus NRRL 1555(-)]|uniref:Uncharacterized protein n=1 Tax=Phycomyces blakesleeanus (strain ATCC 8743b / DSM 1359 / FGSC 10004 / NBRC 33097 / NRRL 1555) TaxID=763407 RepID=A0A162NDI3_PHYB8|nr:hypothetical protein PHYBLDRAFT_173465 [Phycomyces blakesleeanus NRRL 1555(-)]OAD68474.1 hypothetical protein PHYBLDRAFT_173465 [Phycomyces blakesleeanus NRRL 1555(-)]|eukprot:XP_018286514.1 hypothetical protein PHYBLDRAFT_173465 [Phycomyces blakesleeanus NRRL 1555(-)]